MSAYNLAGKLIFIYSSYLLQVETLHDFEAANSDELTLQRGDVVLVVPSDSEADQVKDKDWKMLCATLIFSEDTITS